MRLHLITVTRNRKGHAGPRGADDRGRFVRARPRRRSARSTCPIRASRCSTRRSSSTGARSALATVGTATLMVERPARRRGDARTRIARRDRAVRARRRDRRPRASTSRSSIELAAAAARRSRRDQGALAHVARGDATRQARAGLGAVADRARRCFLAIPVINAVAAAAARRDGEDADRARPVVESRPARGRAPGVRAGLREVPRAAVRARARPHVPRLPPEDRRATCTSADARGAPLRRRRAARRATPITRARTASCAPIRACAPIATPTSSARSATRSSATRPISRRRIPEFKVTLWRGPGDDDVVRVVADRQGEPRRALAPQVPARRAPEAEHPRPEGPRDARVPQLPRARCERQGVRAGQDEEALRANATRSSSSPRSRRARCRTDRSTTRW